MYTPGVARIDRVTTGRMAWLTMSHVCAHPARPEAGVTACDDGRKPHWTAKIEISNMPSQKEGRDSIEIIPESMPRSVLVPLRHAEIAPRITPATADTIRDNPVISKVHGSRSQIMSTMGRLERNEYPKSPVNMSPQ